jgi:GxxExxY protein
MTKTETDVVSGQIVDSAIKVHSAVGPGLLESAYETCLSSELRERGLDVQSQVAVPLVYRGRTIEMAYRIDLLVEDTIVVEVKAVAALLPIHAAQLLSYLRLSDRRVGLLLNFHAPRMRDGIKRIVNGW